MVARLRGAVSAAVARVASRVHGSRADTCIISGFPRSGTTWIAEILSSVDGCGLLFEPLNTATVPSARRAGYGWDNFRTADENWPEGERFMRRVLDGRVLNNWTASRLPLARAARVNRWIVKFVRANPLLGWIANRFPGPPPLLVMRHPCAVYSSWTYRGWPVADYAPPAKARFFSAYPEFLELRESLSSPEEYFAAAWCMEHYAAIDQLKGRQYLTCFYEDLVTEPAREVERICDAWDLTVPARLAEAVAKPSGKASDTLKADPHEQLKVWQNRLPSDVVDRMLEVLRRFGLDFYHTSRYPDRDRFHER